MADGRQFFAAWAPGFKVQSYENLKLMAGPSQAGEAEQMEAATMELEGFSIGESHKPKGKMLCFFYF